MKYYARLDKSNTVIQVIVADSQDYVNALNGDWLETTMDGSIRKNYAGLGYKYDVARDAFIAPKPYASWLLNESTCIWQAPISMPQDGTLYQWNEATLSWIVPS